MARDWLMLENFPEPDAARLRFYGWANPAWTFGYGQKWTEALASSGNTQELIRRPTGGGLVDHRHNWTYALVIPVTHPLAQARACESYRVVHDALSAALTEAGVNNHMQAACSPSVTSPLSLCFEQPARYDVVRTDNGRKIAGAAQKRTRAGLLLQGTVACRMATEVTDWEKLGDQFASQLSKSLNLAVNLLNHQSWPEGEFLVDESSRFASAGWNQRR